MKKLNLVAILVLSGVGISYGQVQITSTTASVTGNNVITTVRDGNNNAVGTSLATTIFTAGANVGQNNGFGNNAFGSGALNSNITGSFNFALGLNSLTANNSGRRNTAIGHESMLLNTTGSSNTAIGSYSLYTNNGDNNVAIGTQALHRNSDGDNNIAIGPNALYNNDDSSNNIGIGEYALHGNLSGTFNTALGRSAGSINSSGDNNVFIGAFSRAETADDNNQLIIESRPIGAPNSKPLIHGDFAANELRLNGKVGIGMNITFPSDDLVPTGDVSNYNLFVLGGILTDEVRIRPSTANNGTSWPDYVFYNDYNLKTLTEVETYINENGHLPNVPSAKQVEAEGIAVSEMITIQQEKIEELTLYIIQLNKKFDAKTEELILLSKDVEALKAANKK